MLQKLIGWKKRNRLRFWAIPLVPVTFLAPLLAGQWLKADSASQPPITAPAPSAASSPVPPFQSLSPSLRSPATLKTPIPKKQSDVSASKPSVPPTSSAPPNPAKPANPTLKATTKRQDSIPPNLPSLPAESAYEAPEIEIKVAVLRDVKGTTLSVSQSTPITDDKGKVHYQLSANQGIWLQPNGAALMAGKQPLPQVIWIHPKKGGLVYLGDRWYRGRMLLVSQGSTLLAVNYVDLEQYLYSVVGSEMHANAPTEALKAQAIAARSYALVHMIRPASPWYHLGNTQRWQVYKGLASEYNTSQQAVIDTAGEILSHKGGIVESLYASTDEIVTRVHKGRGMSQTGAYQLAKQGYDYQSILNYYYPGGQIARLVLK